LAGPSGYFKKGGKTRPRHEPKGIDGNNIRRGGDTMPVRTSGMKGNQESDIKSTAINYVRYWGDAEELGIHPFESSVGTYVQGGGKNYKIIGYQRGHAFSQEGLNHIAPNIKFYQAYLDDMDSGEFEGDKIQLFAIDDDIAKQILDRVLVKGVKYELIDTSPSHGRKVGKFTSR
jgi:hypothetical protein